MSLFAVGVGIADSSNGLKEMISAVQGFQSFNAISWTGLFGQHDVSVCVLRHEKGVTDSLRKTWKK